VCKHTDAHPVSCTCLYSGTIVQQQAHLELVEANIGEEGLQDVGAALMPDAQQVCQGLGQLAELFFALGFHLYCHLHLLFPLPPAEYKASSLAANPWTGYRCIRLPPVSSLDLFYHLEHLLALPLAGPSPSVSLLQGFINSRDSVLLLAICLYCHCHLHLLLALLPA